MTVGFSFPKKFCCQPAPPNPNQRIVEQADAVSSNPLVTAVGFDFGLGFLGGCRESLAVSSGLQALAATEMSALAYRKERL